MADDDELEALREQVRKQQEDRDREMDELRRQVFGAPAASRREVERESKRKIAAHHDEADGDYLRRKRRNKLTPEELKEEADANGS